MFLTAPPTRPSTYSPSPSTSMTILRENLTYSPALPRSRFRERLAKSHITILTEKELEETNPFNDDETRDIVDSEIKPVERPRRRKKRAPPPPGVRNSVMITINH